MGKMSVKRMPVQRKCGNLKRNRRLNVECTRVSTVMKFGGSSVADETCMRRVAEIVLGEAESGSRPCVVLSAMGDTTNALLRLGELATTSAVDKSEEEEKMAEAEETLRSVMRRHEEAMERLGTCASTREEVRGLLADVAKFVEGLRVVGEFSPRASDLLSSFGERMSTRIFAAYIRRLGVDAEQVDAFAEGLFVSTDQHTNGDILKETYQNIAQSESIGGSEGECIPVVTGFLARGKETGEITTLGRGGSDLSATIIGRALGLREVQVWKDVDGVLTTDPRLVAEARTVERLTFEEATELAYFGATVLHPQSMMPVRLHLIHIRVLCLSLHLPLLLLLPLPCVRTLVRRDACPFDDYCDLSMRE